MDIKNYKIVGVSVEVRLFGTKLPELFKGFEMERAQKPEFVAELYSGERLYQSCYGIEYTVAQGYVFGSRQQPRTRMLCSPEWDKIYIENCSCGEDGVMELFLAGFYTYMAGRGGILMHASLVEHMGSCIAFTADSGVGKTTQARLWEQYMDAAILNGDKAYVQTLESEGKILAWGSPWKGSSPYAVNRCAPLKAIIVLEQAKSNAIRRLEPGEAVTKTLRHIFYPSWCEERTRSMLDSADRLLADVPVYLLSCLPDEEAVKITKKAVWGCLE